jgi:hypothetical protein
MCWLLNDLRLLTAFQEAPMHTARRLCRSPLKIRKLRVKPVLLGFIRQELRK